MKFDGLRNLALGKTARQSSLYKGTSMDDASRALADDGKWDFAFHTNIEDNSWWQVDLGAVHPLYYIVVGNRRRVCQERAITLTIETSLDGAAWWLIHTGLISWDDDLVWPLDGLVSARFVRLSLKERTCLHLAKVEVWGTQADEPKPVFYENNPLWMETKPEGLQELDATMTSAAASPEMILDLGDFYCIWALELRKHHASDFDSCKKLKIESSVDGHAWQLIHDGLLVWSKRLYYPLQGETIARYFKLSSPGVMPTGLSQVKVLSRVYHGWEVRTFRSDGLGARMLSLLVALYIAKLLNCDFKLHWQAHRYKVDDFEAEQVIDLESADRIFSEKFLQKHFVEYANVSTTMAIGAKRRLTHRQLTDPSWHELPGVITATHALPTDLFSSRLLPPCPAFKTLFEALPFSQECAHIIDLARKVDLPADYVALHMRFGDMLYRYQCRELVFNFFNRLVPIQLFNMVLKKLKTEKIKVVIFSDDPKILTYMVNCYNVSIATNYLPKEGITLFQKDLFEAVLMSRASRIYGGPFSCYSRFSVAISGSAKYVNVHTLVPEAEKIAYIEADLKRHEDLYPPLHNTLSYAYLYHQTHQTMANEKNLVFLEEAIKNDPEHAILKFLRAIEYFKANQDALGEEALRQLLGIELDQNKDSFNYNQGWMRTSGETRKNYLDLLERNKYFDPLKEAAARGNPYAAAVVSIIC